MKVLLGIIVVALGICVFVFDVGVSYKTSEKVIDVGPIKATADTRKEIHLNPVGGCVLIALGAVVTVWGVKGKK
jgi:hypothetical protein